MATKKSKKDNKLGKAKAIVKKINNDLIDASFSAIETTVKTGEKWQKLTSKLIKKAEPLTKQQINMFVETAESIKGQLETSTDRLKVLVGYDPKMVETAKKMVETRPRRCKQLLPELKLEAHVPSHKWKQPRPGNARSVRSTAHRRRTAPAAVAERGRQRFNG